jgi:hypothetical protein
MRSCRRRYNKRDGVGRSGQASRTITKFTQLFLLLLAAEDSIKRSGHRIRPLKAETLQQLADRLFNLERNRPIHSHLNYRFKFSDSNNP